jgi:hypothetical protein
MKTFLLIVVLFSALLLTPEKARAFSIDQSANQNTNGSQKFNDPDEQMPDFMSAPDHVGSNDGALSFGSAPINIPTQGQYDSGAQTFDQAFAHQQDKQ